MKVAKKISNFDPSSNDEDGSFVARLERLIGTQKKSDIAAKWNIAPSTLNAYLTKGTLPNIKIASYIAKVENVDIGWLIDGEETETIVDAINNDSIKKITEIMTEQELEMFTERLLRNGTSWALLPEKVMKVASMINDLPDESLKEILLLINEAQYCELVGEKFKPTYNKKVSNG
ncbi:hypothetical protein K6327_000877 [Vibrio vulnificus]|nr:hypothetical protein [Vibrio vulnificus]